MRRTFHNLRKKREQAVDVINEFSVPSGKQEGVVFSLDCAYGVFLTEDRVVVSLKGGELYVLTLVADSMRSVRSFHFDKAAASVLTCNVSTRTVS